MGAAGARAAHALVPHDRAADRARGGERAAMHLQAAIRNGVTPEEIREVIIHAGLYAGIPKANAAMKLADEAFG